MLSQPRAQSLPLAAIVAGCVLVAGTSVWHAYGIFVHGPMSGASMNAGAIGSHRDQMTLIAIGVLLALAGLLVRPTVRRAARPPSGTVRKAALCVLTFAMIVDVSKTATLGFVLPGMRAEYGISAQEAALLPVCGLAGTVLGSLVWGFLVDRLGVRRTLLLATLGFIATSVCGSMPTYAGNLVMCGLMGFAVGGLVPVVFSAITALVPAHRVPAVGALVAGIATAGGYLVASQSAVLLGSDHGWRSLWLVGAFSGALLFLVLPCVPAWCDDAARRPVLPPRRAAAVPTYGGELRGRYVFFGFMAGLVALGVLTWVPTVLRSAGLDGGAGERLLASQAWVALPAAVVLALVLSRYSAERCALVVATGAGAALMVTGAVLAAGQHGWPLTVALTATVFFSNAMTAAIVPMASVHFCSQRRGRGIGRIAGASKLGGLVGPVALASVITAPLGFFVVAIVVGAGTVAAGVVMVAQRPPVTAVPLRDDARSGSGRAA